LLAKCWHELEGAGETAMTELKLDRAEDLRWDPPILSFVIERHGGTVLGSSRAKLHEWRVDLDRKTAHCERGRYRQLRPAAPKFDVKAPAARVVDAVTEGPTSESDLVTKGIVVWKGDGGGPLPGISWRKRLPVGASGSVTN
jgi:hypothetical protein